MMKIHALCCACVVLAGCNLYQKAPDLHISPWTEMTVEFQVLDGTNLTRHTWSTSDAPILQQLSKALVVTHVVDLWGIGTMASNKILLKRADGRQFVLYVNEPTKLCLNEDPGPSTGFGLDVTRPFYDQLKSIIETQTGVTVYFYPPKE